MIKPLKKNFKGLIFISGPTNSGKSQLAEYLIKNQESITYIATSKPRNEDLDWQERIKNHKSRRPDSWRLIEHPPDICHLIESIGDSQSILIDSLGGLVEQYLNKKDEDWKLFQNSFSNTLELNYFGIIIVAEEIGWGIVPSTPIGHIYRERLSKLSKLIAMISTKKWLVFNGTAIDLDKIGYQIP